MRRQVNCKHQPNTVTEIREEVSRFEKDAFLKLGSRPKKLINPDNLDTVLDQKEASHIKWHAQNNWRISPDHVVFLGPKPILVKPDEVQNLPVDCSSNAPYIFVEGFGVLESNVITRGQRAQLRCYYDILIRQKDYENLSILSEQQIYELINWDAEKYRQSKI